MMQSKRMVQSNAKRSGFTLIEVIAVLVLLGILAAIALPRYIDMTENARDRAIDSGIAELNGRESLVWGNVLISQDGYQDDATLWTELSANDGMELGSDYTLAVDATGGTITFQNGDPVTVVRAVSTDSSPGSWARGE